VALHGVDRDVEVVGDLLEVAQGRQSIQNVSFAAAELRGRRLVGLAVDRQCPTGEGSAVVYSGELVNQERAELRPDQGEGSQRVELLSAFEGEAKRMSGREPIAQLEGRIGVEQGGFDVGRGE
jgi:hypothetical protein